ncbi:MAG: hypothetical protein OXE05_05625 [Chloroflexi bacterium]|nr:hypothetical protein [Chloroflexota bacterium]
MAVLDTRKAVKTLTGVGFEEAQAEVLVGLVSAEHGELVTKAGLRTELQALELRIEKRFSQLEKRFNQLTIQLVLLFVALAGVLAALELIPR